MLTDDTLQPRPRKIAYQNAPPIDTAEVETPLPPPESPNPPQSPLPFVPSHQAHNSTLTTTPSESLAIPGPRLHPPTATTSHTIPKPLADMVTNILKMTSVLNWRLLQVHAHAQQTTNEQLEAYERNEVFAVRVMI